MGLDAYKNTAYKVNLSAIVVQRRGCPHSLEEYPTPNEFLQGHTEPFQFFHELRDEFRWRDVEVSLEGAVLDVGVQAQVHVDRLLLKTLGTEDEVERLEALCNKSKICRFLQINSLFK